LSRFWLPPLTGPRYVELQAQRECPRCHELLPDNIERADSRIIGLVGGSSSGKSHYIAALIDELLHGKAIYGENIGCARVEALNQEIERRYMKDFYRPVFELRTRLVATAAFVETTDVNMPLIYTMTFPSQSRWRPDRVVNLMFYDAAGEQLGDRRALETFHRYVLNASALIFLVDPLTLPGFKQRLPFHLRSEEHGSTPPADLLNVIVTSAQKYRSRLRRTLSMPIAMTLAKSDLVRFTLEGLGQNTLFLRDTDYPDGFVAEEFNIISREVQSVMLRFGAHHFIEASRASFSRLTFCAVSATGESYDVDRENFRRIRPRRCLDPLLWNLTQLGVIPVRQPAVQRAVAPSPERARRLP
jgi:hypothetical protein